MDLVLRIIVAVLAVFGGIALAMVGVIAWAMGGMDGEPGDDR